MHADRLLSVHIDVGIFLQTIQKLLVIVKKSHVMIIVPCCR